MTSVVPLDKDRLESLKAVALLGHLGFVLAGSVFLGWWAGDWCDRRFETAPWLTVVLVLLFVVAGSRECWRLLKPLLQEEPRHGGPGDGSPRG